jgi:hypothetical protein
MEPVRLVATGGARIVGAWDSLFCDAYLFKCSSPPEGILRLGIQWSATLTQSWDVIIIGYSMVGVREGPICFETFPHAVVCALLGRVVPAKPKKERRLGVLAGIECDRDLLSNIDFIDAALCAVTAENFRRGRTEGLGSSGEGIIVVPKGQLGLTVGVS